MEACVTLESKAFHSVEFVLSAPDAKEMSESARGLSEGFNKRPAPYFAALYGALALAEWWLYTTSITRIGLFQALAFSLITVIWTCTWLAQRAPPRRVKLTFGDSVIGSLDGKPVDFQWSRISAARLMDSFVLLSVRSSGFMQEIAIPKRAFADQGTAFWAFLNGRLTGKRYLIRGAAPRTLLINTISRAGKP